MNRCGLSRLVMWMLLQAILGSLKQWPESKRGLCGRAFEGCEEHDKFFFWSIFCSLTLKACRWDKIIDTLYRSPLALSVKIQVGSHFPLNLSCIQSLFIHCGNTWGLTLLVLLLLLLPVAIGLSLHFQTTTLNG